MFIAARNSFSALAPTERTPVYFLDSFFDTPDNVLALNGLWLKMRGEVDDDEETPPRWSLKVVR